MCIIDTWNYYILNALPPPQCLDYTLLCYAILVRSVWSIQYSANKKSPCLRWGLFSPNIICDQPIYKFIGCPYLWSDWYIVPNGPTVIRQVQQMLTLNTIAYRLRKYLGSHPYCIMYSTTLLINQPLKLVRLQRSVSQLLFLPTPRTFGSLLPGRSYVVGSSPTLP